MQAEQIRALCGLIASAEMRVMRRERQYARHAWGDRNRMVAVALPHRSARRAATAPHCAGSACGTGSRPRPCRSWRRPPRCQIDPGRCAASPERGSVANHRAVGGVRPRCREDVAKVGVLVASCCWCASRRAAKSRWMLVSLSGRPEPNSARCRNDLGTPPAVRRLYLADARSGSSPAPG